jgi:hypothetical protein
MDQDQLTAAIVAGVVIISSSIGMTLSLCGCCRRRPGLYDLQEDPEV